MNPLCSARISLARIASISRALRIKSLTASLLLLYSPSISTFCLSHFELGLVSEMLCLGMGESSKSLVWCNITPYIHQLFECRSYSKDGLGFRSSSSSSQQLPARDSRIKTADRPLGSCPLFLLLAERVGFTLACGCACSQAPPALRESNRVLIHLPLLEIKNGATRAPFLITGGEGGIRTHGTGEPYT